MSFSANQILTAAELNDLDIDSLVVDTDVLVVDKTNNRVGIGTTSPAADLDVSAASSPDVRLTSEKDGSWSADESMGSLSFYSSDTSGGGPGVRGRVATVAGDTFGYASELAFSVNGDSGLFEIMRLDHDGNVGIGTTSPVTDLHIASTDTSIYLQDTNGTVGGSMSAYVRMTDSAGSVQGAVGFVGTSSGVMVVDNNDGPILFRSLSNDSLIFETNGSYRQTIFGNGNVSFHSGALESDGTYANTTGSGANMHISSGGFFFRSTSSGKYKTDVETMEDSYADSILGLRPVWYRSLSEHDPDSWGYWGFIAEEVAEVDPRLVSFGVPDDYEWQYDEDDQKLEPDVADLTEPEGVQYDRLVPHLVNLLARQRDQIADLSARVTELEA